MTSKKAIYLIIGLILTFLVVRFLLNLFKDGPGKPKSKVHLEAIPAGTFPICQGSPALSQIISIQKYLNKNMTGYVKAPLKEDGDFGSLTEGELKFQKSSICVSKAMYISMV